MNSIEENGEHNIPKQVAGSDMNAVEKITCASEDEAKTFYQVVKQRLLEVYRWYELSDVPLSTFTLTDHSGEPIKRNAREGDYVKIDIPGPGTSTGDGFDWVHIEYIREEVFNEGEWISMTVRPSPNPLHNESATAHFLKDAATSTFQVKRIGNQVYAEEHGRNEMPNSDTGNLGDDIRNTLVGWSAKIGFSYPQWKSLVKGLLHFDK